MDANPGVVGAVVTGIKAPFVYTCPSCAKQYQTKDEYTMTQNIVQSSVESTKRGIIFRIVRKFLGWIPFIGYQLSHRTSSAISRTAKGGKGDNANQLQKAQTAGFKEVEHHFKECSECGSYGCEECMSGESLCPTCKAK